MIGLGVLSRRAPYPADVAALVADARRLDPALAASLATADSATRAGDEAGVVALVALLERAGSWAEPPAARAVLLSFARLWGLSAMPIAAGDLVARHPLAWLELADASPPGATIAHVCRQGILLDPGIVVRMAEVELASGSAEEAGIEPTDASADDPARMAEQLADQLDGLAPAELVDALAARAAGPLERDLALALADHALLWASGSRQRDEPPTDAIQHGLDVLAGEVVAAFASSGVGVFPHPAELGVPLDALRGQFGRDAFQFRGRWSDDVPSGGLLWVERLGIRDTVGTGSRPARVWISRGPMPEEVSSAALALERILEHASVDPALAVRGPRWIEDLAHADREVRVRALLGLVNAADQLRCDAGTGADGPLGGAAQSLVELLDRAGVEEVPIAVGDAFDRHPPDLYHVRRATRPGARYGEITAVARRAFRESGGGILQQATIEVNLGEV